MKYLILLLLISCANTPVVEVPVIDMSFSCPVYDPKFADYILPKNNCMTCIDNMSMCLGRKVIESTCQGTPYTIYAEEGDGWEIDRYVGTLNINTQVCIIKGTIVNIDGPPVHCNALKAVTVYCDEIK